MASSEETSGAAEELYLWCMLVGVKGDGFSIRTTRTTPIDDLKNKIKGKKPLTIKCDADELELFLTIRRTNTAGDVVEWLPDDDELVGDLRKGEISDGIQALTTGAEPLRGSRSLPWSDLPPVSHSQIHILVKLPEVTEVAVPVASQQSQLKKWHLNPILDNGASARWRDAYVASRIAHDALPPFEDLPQFIETMLPMRVKVNNALFQYVKMRMSIQDVAMINSIFEVDEETPCTELWSTIISPIIVASADGSTERAFHSFWDKIVRDPLLFAFSRKVQTDRCDRKFASTGASRPDFFLKADSVCVFRGEEEAVGVDISVARRELTSKLVWTYGDVPYLFGYAASGFTLSLYTIVCGIDGTSHTYPLGTYDLQYLNGRLELLRALLNIGRLFHGIAELCPDSGRGEYLRLVNHSSGIVVDLEQTKVAKSFPNSNLLNHLTCVYGMLAANAVPNVDRMCSVHPDSNAIVLEPRGTEWQPSSLDELFCALRDVLAALVKLHAASWMHRDIRWPNVIKCRDNSDKWFLIDFCDAATYPQTAPSGQHLSKEAHAPEIHDAANHTSAVDIWSVGYLITSSYIYGSWQDGGPRDDFVRHLKHSNPAERLTAATAIGELERLEQEFKATRQEAAAKSERNKPNMRKKARKA